MAMTKTEYYAKQQILQKLNEQGYPTYAKLLNEYDVNLTADPDVVGYTEVGRGRIVLNKNLKIDQVSMVVRHEILHNFLKHMLRMEKKLGKDVWDARTPEMHERSNIAGDYEISNRGYTDADKSTARAIELNGQFLKGLVTEDDHPDWVDKSLEEMYDLLEKEQPEGGQGGGQGGQSGQSQGKGGLVIGGTGNPEIQEAEDIQRQAEAIIDDAGDIVKKAKQQGDSEGQQEAQKAKDEAEKAKDRAKDIKDGLQGKETKSDVSKDGVPTEKKPFGDPEKIQKRLQGLKRILDNLDETINADSLTREAEASKTRERIEKEGADLKKYKDTPLYRFKESLNGFIAKEVSVGRDKTWKRFNKNYSNSEILRPGTSRRVLGKIPLINVYFDQSGSWDQQMIAVGNQAIATLKKYVQAGQIKIRVYYFSDTIFTDVNSRESHQSTSAGPDIVEHIKDTHADNVIIMTDSDCDNQGNWNKVKPITVDGAVWFLFQGGRSSKLMQYIRGARLTKAFDLDSRSY